jgi:rRNA processing protein Krr1/Pno1
MECIARIIGKGGETLKKIRQTSGALVDIFTDHENKIAVISGPSVEAVDTAKLEIGKLLRTFAPSLMEKKRDDPLDIAVGAQFPPGYSDNFSKANLRYSRSDSSLTNVECSENSYYQTDYNNSTLLDSSLTPSICEAMKWHTIKGGKAIEGEQVTKNSKKKRKNRAIHQVVV